MKIKTFYAKTMAQALQQIKTSLGPDALLLSTKEIARRSGVWGKSSGFEVVAATDNADDIDGFYPSEKADPEVARMDPPQQEVTQSSQKDSYSEIYSPSTLAQNALTASRRRTRAKRNDFEANPELSDEIAAEKGVPFKGRISLGLYQDLVQSGVDEPLARTLITSALDSLSGGQRRSRAALMRSLCQATLDRISLPSNENGLPEKRVVAFVGPTGVGKTTSLAKLAAHLALQKKMKVILMTLDGCRIGAVEQLRCYAGLMGIPFRFVDDVSDLPQAIEENSQRDCILIDTAGRGPRDLAGMQPLADYLKRSEQIERHLVLSASTKPSDMRQIMDQFEICCPDHLLFTKLDETSSPGPILNELVRTGKCFSYYTDGQRVPDDLRAAPREHFMDIVLRRNNHAFKE
jgi:flagellar biosynthesis protein FlhF